LPFGGAIVIRSLGLSLRLGVSRPTRRAPRTARSSKTTAEHLATLIVHLPLLGFHPLLDALKLLVLDRVDAQRLLNLGVVQDREGANDLEFDLLEPLSLTLAEDLGDLLLGLLGHFVGAIPHLFEELSSLLVAHFTEVGEATTAGTATAGTSLTATARETARATTRSAGAAATREASRASLSDNAGLSTWTGKASRPTWGRGTGTTTAGTTTAGTTTTEHVPHLVTAGVNQLLQVVLLLVGQLDLFLQVLGGKE
jgi:hypothetical protein